MKPLRNKPVLWACLAALALLGGCGGKKPKAVAQQQPPAPAAAPQPAPEPTPEAPRPQNQESQAPSQGTPPPDQAQTQAPAENADKAKPKTKPPTTKKTGSQDAARSVPPKIVVKPDAAEPASTPGQISPSVSSAQAGHDQATTEQLLQTTETSLNGIKRELSKDEQAIVTQIRDFMKQSRQAITQNDLVRAHNLATKAHLLSDELVKRR